MQRPASRVARAAALVTALLSGALLTQTVANADDPPIISLIERSLAQYIPLEVSADGRFVLLNDLDTGFFRLDVQTGDEIAVPDQFDWLPPTPTLFEFDVVDTDTFVKLDVATGTETTFDVDLGEDWPLRAVPRADRNGRIVVLVGGTDDGFRLRSFVFDTELGQFVFGPPGGISDANNTVVVDLAPDGSELVFLDYCCVGANTSRYVRAYTDGQPSDVYEMPDEHDPSAGFWTMSPDLAWIWFVSADPVVDGVPGGTMRWYRRATATGDTAVVPVPAGELAQTATTNAGRMLFTRDHPAGASDARRQLFVWDGQGEPRMLSVTPEGEAADLPTSTFWVAEDGRDVTFQSFATDIVEGADNPNGSLFRLRLPRLGALPFEVAQQPASPVAASSTYCSPVVGAAPGDIVGVNVTPVDAGLGGFGTLHSSDDPAGATSNVNFGLGTIDPNVAFVAVGDDGQVCFTNSVHGPVNVVLDQQIVARQGTIRPPTADGAARLADTREGVGGGIIGPEATRCFDTVGSLPGDYVGLNATPVEATTGGFGTLHSSNDPAGATSNVNFGLGTIDPNLAITRVGDDGQVCFTNSIHGSVHLVLDQLIVADPNAFFSQTPDGAARLTDTRIARH